MQLIGVADPVGSLIAEFAATDLRPCASLLEVSPDQLPAGPVVLSGPNDLVELRAVVERVTGPGSWFVHRGTEVAGTVRRGSLDVARLAQIMGLVTALEGLISDNGGAWRTWKTTVETIAAGVGDLERLTLESVVVDLA